MTYKQLWLPIKVENFINVQNKDGIWHCHIIIDENDLTKIKNLVVYEDWDSVPVEYKNADGGQIHSYLGFSKDVDTTIDGKTTKITVPNYVVEDVVDDGYGDGY